MKARVTLNLAPVDTRRAKLFLGSFFICLGLLVVFCADKINSPWDNRENWGQTTDGFTLSVGFSKEEYNTGEAIVADVSLHSVQNVRIFNLAYPEDLFEFTIVDFNKSLVSRSNGNDRFSKVFNNSVRPANVGPENDLKYSIRLDDKYVLNKMGSYVITVSRKIVDSSKKSITVYSGNAIIHIVDKQKPDDASAKPAQSSPSTKATPALGGKVPLVSSPNVMGRAATGNVGNSLAGSMPGEASSAGTSDDSSKRGVVGTVSRFLTQGGAESSGRWGKIAVLLIFLVAAFLFMRRST